MKYSSDAKLCWLYATNTQKLRYRLLAWKASKAIRVAGGTYVSYCNCKVPIGTKTKAIIQEQPGLE